MRFTMAKKKEETITSYDNNGNGSLVVLETDKSYGKSGKAVTTKQGYTYDRCRNVLTEKANAAYQKKNQGKEHLYTTKLYISGRNISGFGRCLCLPGAYSGIIQRGKDQKPHGKHDGGKRCGLCQHIRAEKCKRRCIPDTYQNGFYLR